MRRAFVVLGAAATLLSACSTLLSIDDDTSAPPPSVLDATAADAPVESSAPPGDAALDSGDAGDAAAPRRPIAFVSSIKKPGDSGRSALDLFCQQRAMSANLPGNYQALLASTTTSTPDPTIRLSKTWYRVDAKPLFAGNLLAPVNPFLTETGETLAGSALVWTGMGGTSANTCADWTSVVEQGAVGDPNSTDKRWLDQGSATCAISLHVYCFEQ